MNQRVATNVILHSERVLPSFASFLPATLLIPTVWLTLSPFDPTIGWIIGLGMAFVVWALQIAFAPRIQLTQKSLTVGNATIERKYLGKAKVIPKKDAFKELGPGLNARAFIKVQSSVRTLVRVEITDAKDPAPYWLFSTRNAEKLVKLLKK
jgi:hypothetical protein